MAMAFTATHIPKSDTDSNAVPLHALQGGSIKQISYNPYDNGTFLASGNSHANGGIKADSTGNGRPDVEIEGGETVHVSPVDNSKVVGGNLFIPGTKTKFKKAFKSIAEAEIKAQKVVDKSTTLLEKKNPENKIESLAYNAGAVMKWSANRQQQALAQEKESLTQTQEAIHNVAATLGVEPKEIGTKMKWGGKIGTLTVVGVPEMKDGGKLPIAKDGYKTQNESIFKALEKHPERMKYVDWAKEAADAEGIDPGFMHRLLFRESGFNPSLTSGAGAKGIAQFMPSTYKGMGGNPADFGSTSEESVRRQLAASAKYLKHQLDTNNNDYMLAAAAYNGGPGAIDYVKKATKNPNLTGEDWMAFMDNRRQSAPTSKKGAWQNQTYNYVKGITTPTNDQFYSGQVPEGVQNNASFQSDYYSRPEIAVPTPLSPVAGKLPLQPIAPAMLPEPTAVNYNPQDMLNSFSYPKPSNYRKPSLADNNKLGVGNFLGEIAALADSPDFVPHQRLNPHLYTPYNVSFQDRLNENNASFKSMESALVNNPQALTALAAQQYSANSGVLADQFRTNQGIENDVLNKNISIINSTREKNLALADTQYQRMTAAKENTKQNKLAAVNSISNKFLQNRLENNNIRMSEQTFNYRWNSATNQMEYVGPDAVFGQGITPYNPNAERTRKTVTDSDGDTTTTLIEKLKAANARGRKWGGKVKR